MVIARNQILLLSLYNSAVMDLLRCFEVTLTLQRIQLLSLPLHYNKLARAQTKPTPLRALESRLRLLSVQD